jgi:hypothetical protein
MPIPLTPTTHLSPQSTRPLLTCVIVAKLRCPSTSALPPSSSAPTSHQPRRNLRRWNPGVLLRTKIPGDRSDRWRISGGSIPEFTRSSHPSAALRIRETTALKVSAVEAGCLLDSAEFARRCREQAGMDGSENCICYNEATGRAWKRNRIDVFHLSWRQFFDRLLTASIFRRNRSALRPWSNTRVTSTACFPSRTSLPAGAPSTAKPRP